MVTPPKEKIVLCAGKLFLWFNTEARRPAQMRVQPGEVPGITRLCYLDCGRVTVFPEHELASARDQGAASNQFLSRVIEEVETRATTLTTLQRRSVTATLRVAVDPRNRNPF